MFMMLNKQAMHYIKYNSRAVNRKINFEIKTVDGLRGEVRIWRKGYFQVLLTEVRIYSQSW